MFEVRSPSGRLIRRIASREHAERLRSRGHAVTPAEPAAGPASSDGVAKPSPRREPPQPIACEHRGEQLRSDECPTCHGRVSVKVFACDVASIGECQLGNKLAGVKSCVGCVDRVPAPAAAVTPHSPSITSGSIASQFPSHSSALDAAPSAARRDPQTVTAPLFNRSVSDHPWEGVSLKKPWDYRVTATIAVLNPTDSLACVIDTLRAQTERPYIIVVDTGSTWPNLESLHRRFESDEDVEIHSLRSRGWRHSSAPVGAALDVALATCHTEFLYMTHDDVFLKRNDYISDLLRLHEQTKAVAIGYEMSPRDWLTDQWKGMVSHTATLCHAPTLHRIGASWSFERSHHQWNVPRTVMGWPDTETAFGLLLREIGLRPHLIGRETNFDRFEDDNLVHCRSYTGSRLYSAEHHKKSSRWIADEIATVRRRLRGA